MLISIRVAAKLLSPVLFDIMEDDMLWHEPKPERGLNRIMRRLSNYSYSIITIFSGLLMVWSPIKIGFNVENMKKSSVETEHLLLLSAR